MSNLDPLSAGQREAVDQFTAVTAQPAAQAIAQLQRADWNVELAVARFFDGEAADSVAEALQAEEYARAGQAAHSTAHNTAPTTATAAPGHAGSTAAELARRAGSGLTPAPRIVPQPAQLARKPPLLLALLLLPFSVVWRLAHGAVGLLYLIFPFLPRFRAPGTFAGTAAGTGAGLGSGSGSGTPTTVKRSPDPRDTAARFIRAFEEECGVAQRLPWFEGGYAQALDRAKTELRFLLVVLQSDEHDDTAEFNRETLASAPVAALLAAHDVLLWGGSVTASEAYQVAAALGCTHFPFAALITHAPRGAPAAASSQGMSVVCKIAGPCAPDAFVRRLAAAIDAHAPALDRIRAQRAARDADRLIRDQQNSAYEASLARDRQRAAERRAADEAAARAEADAARRAAEASSLARKRDQWRRWRAHTLAAEPPAAGSTAAAAATAAAIPAARVSIRTSDGKRVVRRFAPDASMEEVYAFVECLDVPREEADGEQQQPLRPPNGYTHRYAFRLVSVMPRQVFEPHAGTVADGLWPSGNLVVERLDDDDDDDDGDDGGSD